MNVKLTDLSLVGWLLALTTMAVVAALMIFSGTLFGEMIPNASGATAHLLAIPGPIIGIIFFGITAFVLGKFGMPVLRKSRMEK